MSEIELQLQICQYLRLQYKYVLFRSDFASGMKLSIAQAVKHKALQSGRAFPDLMIYEARGGYVGLALELKRDGTTIYTRTGELVADEHIREQAAILQHLGSQRWHAGFGVGFYPTKHIIDTYLKYPASWREQ